MRHHEVPEYFFDRQYDLYVKEYDGQDDIDGVHEEDTRSGPLDYDDWRYKYEEEIDYLYQEYCVPDYND